MRDIWLQKSAETHLPLLEAKEGILITMYDLDGQHVWNFKYRFESLTIYTYFSTMID